MFLDQSTLTGGHSDDYKDASSQSESRSPPRALEILLREPNQSEGFFLTQDGLDELQPPYLFVFLAACGFRCLFFLVCHGGGKMRLPRRPPRAVLVRLWRNEVEL